MIIPQPKAPKGLAFTILVPSKGSKEGSATSFLVYTNSASCVPILYPRDLNINLRINQ